MTLPAGWTEASVTLDHAASFSADTLSFRLRHGLSPRAELWWQAPAHAASVGGERIRTWGDPSFGVRWLLHRREAPARSVALEALYQASFASASPLEVGTGEDVSAALLFRQQWGGLLFDGAFGGGVATERPAGHLDGAVEVLLQAGPVAGGLSATQTRWWPDASATALGLRLLAQPTRGVDAELHWAWPLAESGLVPTDLARRPQTRVGATLGARW